jgi:hypothetical protein
MRKIENSGFALPHPHMKLEAYKGVAPVQKYVWKIEVSLHIAGG